MSRHEKRSWRTMFSELIRRRRSSQATVPTDVRNGRKEIAGEELLRGSVGSTDGRLSWPSKRRLAAEFFQLLHRCPARDLQRRPARRHSRGSPWSPAAWRATSHSSSSLPWSAHSRRDRATDRRARELGSASLSGYSARQQQADHREETPGGEPEKETEDKPGTPLNLRIQPSPHPLDNPAEDRIRLVLGEVPDESE